MSFRMYFKICANWRPNQGWKWPTNCFNVDCAEHSCWGRCKLWKKFWPKMWTAAFYLKFGGLAFHCLLVYFKAIAVPYIMPYNLYSKSVKGKNKKLTLNWWFWSKSGQHFWSFFKVRPIRLLILLTICNVLQCWQLINEFVIFISQV